ncbi:tryptophan-rich sensory protein [Hymenobacter metallicola]|uniref:Tryptophan-rich sensory protein n=1 Tax=Hymenobacter metallicola TaxID=2563114 RepID=A0A4Z0Q9U8_9BACT|nr:tryptophan-rich sensory protein [Hymenobacter metallicola]TGE26216.1 tryptophan-rich sensory protein [Hymenobacter metallicola]
MNSSASATQVREYAPVSAWRWLASLSILGNIGLNYWANAHPFNGQTMGAVSAKYPTMLTPAGYAFSIWGVIFLALTVYAVWQLLPAQRATSLPGTLARPLTLASVATASWVVLFAYELIELSVLAMLVLLGSLILTYGRARKQTLAHKVPRWVSIPFALYLGWISVATVLNVTIGLRELGWQTETNIAVLLTLLLLAVVVGLALVVSKVFRELVFPAVVVWALVAIWVAQRGAYPELGWAALVGAGVVAVGGTWLGLRRSRRRTR